MESDRLLMEELKGELSQTKLELETTLKAQHKHLKELDTLRLDMTPLYGHVIVSATDADDIASVNRLRAVDFSNTQTSSAETTQSKCLDKFPLFYYSMSP